MEANSGCTPYLCCFLCFKTQQKSKVQIHTGNLQDKQQFLPGKCPLACSVPKIAQSTALL